MRFGITLNSEEHLYLVASAMDSIGRELKRKPTVLEVADRLLPQDTAFIKHESPDFIRSLLAAEDKHSIIAFELYQELLEEVKNLPPEEKTKLRGCFLTKDHLTLEETANALYLKGQTKTKIKGEKRPNLVTRERTRQIEFKALRKLKRHPKFKQLSNQLVKYKQETKPGSGETLPTGE